MVKGEDKRRGTQWIGRIEELFVRKDGIIRDVLNKTAKGFSERPVQLLNPLKLHCSNITDDSNDTDLRMTKEGNTNGKLNPEALTFRPKQTAAVISSIKRNDMFMNYQMSETCRLSRITYDLVKMLVELMYKNFTTSVSVHWGRGWFTYLYFCYICHKQYKKLYL